MLTESVTKIIVAVALIGLGFGVYAAITGVLFGLFLSFLISLMMIGEIAKSEKKDAEVGEIYKYGLSVFLMMFVVMLMYSLDIIFAKIFFTSEMAGKYAVASMIGKMIFFGTAPISKTMFPITSQGFDEGKITKKAFIKSVAMVFAVSLVPLLVMFLYPEILIRLLFGKAYLDVAPILFYLGLGLTLLAFTNLFLIYGIAINKTKKAYIFLIFVVIEVGLLSIFHSTINLFSLAFLVSNAIMFIASAIWLAFAKK